MMVNTRYVDPAAFIQKEIGGAQERLPRTFQQALGMVHAAVMTDSLENITNAFARLDKEEIAGRVVIDFEKDVA